MKIDQWDGIKSTEISCYAAGQPIFSKCAKAIGGAGGTVLKRLFCKRVVLVTSKRVKLDPIPHITFKI